jgi:hypothetical protein
LTVCAHRGAARRRPRLDDLLAHVQRPAGADAPLGVIVPFPSPELARHRAMAAHPSAHSLSPARPSVR